MLPTSGVPFIGRIILLLAFAAALYNVGATAWAYRVNERQRALWISSAHNAALAVWILLEDPEERGRVAVDGSRREFRQL